MPKINILYYEPTSGYGGSSRCLLTWLKKINRENYKPIIVVHNHGPAIKKMKALGLKVLTIPRMIIAKEQSWPVISYIILITNILADIPIIVILYLIIKINRIELIHLNAKIISVIPGIIAAKMARVPCICHLHDIKVPVKRERIFSKWVNCFIVLTEKAYELYKKEYSDSRLELIPNGIELMDADCRNDIQKIRIEFNILENEFVIGMIGRLVEGKGFSDFIKAAQILSKASDNVRFLIVGSATGNELFYEKYLKTLVKELDLESKIIFTGWREDVKQIMSALDVIVQASSTFPEGFGLTVIEAMALSKPVIVTNVPGPAEIVDHGIDGYIVPPSNPEKLAEAMIILLNDKQKAKEMGLIGKSKVAKKYNVIDTIRKLEKIYDSLSIKSRIYD